MPAACHFPALTLPSSPSLPPLPPQHFAVSGSQHFGFAKTFIFHGISAGPFYWIAEVLGKRVPPSSITGCDFVSNSLSCTEYQQVHKPLCCLKGRGGEPKP